MRTLAAVAGLAVLLASVPAEAGWWIFHHSKDPYRKNLPPSLDFPIVRPKVQETHKNGKRAGDHPEHQRQQH